MIGESDRNSRPDGQAGVIYSLFDILYTCLAEIFKTQLLLNRQSVPASCLRFLGQDQH